MAIAPGRPLLASYELVPVPELVLKEDQALTMRYSRFPAYRSRLRKFTSTSQQLRMLRVDAFPSIGRLRRELACRRQPLGRPSRSWSRADCCLTGSVSAVAAAAPTYIRFIQCPKTDRSQLPATAIHVHFTRPGGPLIWPLASFLDVPARSA